MESPPSSRDAFNFQGAMYAVPWLLTAMSIWAAGARVYVRRKYSRTVDADDWVMLVAVMFQIVYQAIITIDITKGVGKSTAPTSTDDDFVDLLKWAWISSALACLVSVTARLSIAIFLIRAFGSRAWYKWFMVIFTSVIAILGVVNIVIIWFQTRPVQALWDFRIHVSRWDPKVQRILSSILHGFLAASILLFAAFPVSFAWRLHTDPLRKIVLGLLLALSVFTFGIAIEKLVLIVSPMGAMSGDTADMLYKFSVLSLISGVEQNLVIIIGSTPKLSTLLKIDSPSFSLLSKGVREKQDRGTKGSPPTSSSFKSSPWPCDRSGSSELETQPHLFRFDRVNQMETLVCRYSMASIDREQEGNAIRRTDKFVIVDNKAPIPRGCI